MPAVQMADEVGSAEVEGAFLSLHGGWTHANSNGVQRGQLKRTQRPKAAHSTSLPVCFTFGSPRTYQVFGEVGSKKCYGRDEMVSRCGRCCIVGVFHRKPLLAAFILSIAFVINLWSMALADEPISRYVRKSSEASTVIVFVHGFLGDGITTWSNASAKQYWPEMLTRDSTFDNADVFEYTYDTGISATLTIDEIADNMHNVFVASWITTYNNVIVLSHSMGGLVTRAYLLKHREIASHIQFLYFYSVPTTGSQIASIVTLLVGSPQVEKLRSMNTDEFLADQLRQWLSARFNFSSYCAYEKKPTMGMAIVVQMESAVALCTGPVSPIDADHFVIVKPASEIPLRTSLSKLHT